MGGHRACTLIGERPPWRVDRGRARGDRARAHDGTRRTRRCRQLWHGLEFHPSRGNELQKSVLPAEQDRPDVARRRARWKNIRRGLILPVSSSSTETWVKTNMAPHPRLVRAGPEARAKIPLEDTTFLAALRCDRTRPHGFSMVQSTARASGPMSIRFPVPTLKPATSSSSIISVATRARRCAAPSGLAEPGLLFAAHSPDLNSHRTGLRQTETSHAKGQGANQSTLPETHRLIARNLQIQRMQKLLHQCRLRFIPKMIML